MENKGLEIRTLKDQSFMGVEMVIFERDYNNKIANVGKLIMEKHDICKPISYQSRIQIGDKTAQTLMDDLWSCGFRPTEGTGSAGSLKATQNHLEDMRDIAKKSVELLIEHAKMPKIIESSISKGES